jgi:pyroglutamyl-peptidase
MKPLLVTGFGAFGSVTANPTEQVARALDGMRLADGRRIVGAVLPVSAARAPGELDALLAAHDPVAVVLTGGDERAVQLKLETTAANQLAFRIADNDGAVHQGRPVIAGQAASLPSSLPLDTIERALLRAAVLHARSDDAGRYLCNQTFFHLRATRPDLAAGFIHVPPLETWPVEQTLAAIRLIAEATNAALAPAPAGQALV